MRRKLFTGSRSLIVSAQKVRKWGWLFMGMELLTKATSGRKGFILLRVPSYNPSQLGSH